MGAQFGPFRLITRIGRGGMAETFEAERPRLSEFSHLVCLKRILARQQAEEEWVRRFHREVRTTGMLHHPNIVALHDVGQEEGTWWMSLELHRGRDLRRVIAHAIRTRTPLPIELVVFIAAELAKGLAHAHSLRLDDGKPAGIIHRDVSPSNVLISYDGAVKLSDFGLAVVVEDELTKSGEIRGKAPYMSPEHLMGRPMDGRSDLFGVGILMFEMLTGVRPFEGRTHLETQVFMVEGKRQADLRRLAPHAPEHLARLVESLIGPTPDLRPQSANALLVELSETPVRLDVVHRLGALVRAVPETAASYDAADGSADARRARAPGPVANDIPSQPVSSSSSAASPRRSMLIIHRVPAGPAGPARLVAVAPLQLGQQAGMERALVWTRSGAELDGVREASEHDLLQRLGPPDMTTFRMMALPVP